MQIWTQGYFFRNDLFCYLVLEVERKLIWGASHSTHTTKWVAKQNFFL